MTTLCEADADTRTASFAITAERCPQVLCRLLGLVAQQGRLVAWLHVKSSTRSYRVSLGVPEIDSHRAEILGHKMGALVSVRTVRVRVD